MGEEASKGDVEYLLAVVKRAEAMAALRDEPLTRRELESRLDVSRATVHRLTSALADHGLVERTNAHHELTPLGETVAAELAGFGETVSTARELQPLFAAADGTPVDVDPELFLDAETTVSTPGTPYAPVRRFVELLDETETVRGFDTTALAPVSAEEVFDVITDGMQTEVIYEPSIIESIVESYPDRSEALLDRDNLTVYVHESLPFGLTLYESRVGVGAYDGRTGTLQLYVDTDDRDALAWGERVYEHYRERAEPLKATDRP